MVQGKIHPIQLFVLMVLFELGSSVVVGLGMEAKQDAWLAILLGMTGGMVVFSLYVYLYSQFPTLPLTNYFEKIVGKVIGRILAVTYIGYFLYIAARILRDFSDLLLTTILYETPLLAVTIVMMIAICFGCYLGFEVITRTVEIFFPWITFFGFLFALFIFIGGLPKLENLQPVLEAGWKPVFHAAFPSVLTFPFGETIVFAMFLPYLYHSKPGIIAGFFAIIYSGLVLTITTTIIISVLGPYAAAKSTFPLLDTIEKVNVGDVFQRLDPIAIILLIMGGFFKMIVFFCGAVEGISSLVNKPHLMKIFLPIMALAVIGMSILMSDNYVEHIKIGVEVVPKFIHVPLQVIIPFLLVIIVVVKKKMMKKQTKA